MYLGNPRFQQRQNISQVMSNYQKRTLPYLGGKRKTKRFVKKVKRNTKKNK